MSTGDGEMPPEREEAFLARVGKDFDNRLERLIEVESLVVVATAEWLCKAHAGDKQALTENKQNDLSAQPVGLGAHALFNTVIADVHEAELAGLRLPRAVNNEAVYAGVFGRWLKRH